MGSVINGCGSVMSAAAPVAAAEGYIAPQYQGSIVDFSVAAQIDFFAEVARPATAETLPALQYAMTRFSTEAGIVLPLQEDSLPPLAFHNEKRLPAFLDGAKIYLGNAIESNVLGNREVDRRQVFGALGQEGLKTFSYRPALEAGVLDPERLLAQVNYQNRCLDGQVKPYVDGGDFRFKANLFFGLSVPIGLPVVLINDWCNSLLIPAVTHGGLAVCIGAAGVFSYLHSRGLKQHNKEMENLRAALQNLDQARIDIAETTRNHV